MSIVQHIWKRSKELNGDVSHRRTKNSGIKKIQTDLAQFRNIPLTQRTTIRGAANALNVNTSKLNWCLKSEIRHQTNDIKPLLKEENKKTRLRFCLSMLDKDSVHHEPKFRDMYNIIHIDEKWSYSTKKIWNILSSFRSRCASSHVQKQKLCWKSDVSRRNCLSPIWFWRQHNTLWKSRDMAICH